MADETVNLHPEGSASGASSLPRRARGASAIQRPPPQVRQVALPPELGRLAASLDLSIETGPAGELLPARAKPAPSAPAFPPAAAAVARAAAQARAAADARAGNHDIVTATLAAAQARAAALARATAAAPSWSLRTGSDSRTARRLRLAGILIALLIVVPAIMALVLGYSGR